MLHCCGLSDSESPCRLFNPVSRGFGGLSGRGKNITVSPEPSVPEWGRKKPHYCITRALCSRMEKKNITVSPEPSVPEWKKTHYCIARALCSRMEKKTLLYRQSPLFQNGKNKIKKILYHQSRSRMEKTHYCVTRALCLRMEKKHITLSPEPSYFITLTEMSLLYHQTLIFHKRHSIIVPSEPSYFIRETPPYRTLEDYRGN